MIQITEGCRMPVKMKNTEQWRKYFRIENLKK